MLFISGVATNLNYQIQHISCSLEPSLHRNILCFFLSIYNPHLDQRKFTSPWPDMTQIEQKTKLEFTELYWRLYKARIAYNPINSEITSFLVQNPSQKFSQLLQTNSSKLSESSVLAASQKVEIVHKLPSVPANNRHYKRLSLRIG